MHAYLINPDDRTVEPVEYELIMDLHRLLGGEDCDVHAATLHQDVDGNRDVIFYDPQQTRPPAEAFAVLGRSLRLFFGRGVVLSMDMDLMPRAPETSLDEVRRLVRFL